MKKKTFAKMENPEIKTFRIALTHMSELETYIMKKPDFKTVICQAIVKS